MNKGPFCLINAKAFKLSCNLLWSSEIMHISKSALVTSYKPTPKQTEVIFLLFQWFHAEWLCLSEWIGQILCVEWCQAKWLNSICKGEEKNTFIYLIGWWNANLVLVALIFENGLVWVHWAKCREGCHQNTLGSKKLCHKPGCQGLLLEGYVFLKSYNPSNIWRVQRSLSFKGPQSQSVFEAKVPLAMP